jgi:hypothetical protein
MNGLPGITSTYRSERMVFMSSLILWGLVAFLVVDLLSIVLVARSGESRTMLGSGRTTVQQAPIEAPDAVEPERQISSEHATALPSPAAPSSGNQDKGIPHDISGDYEQDAQYSREGRDGQQHTRLSAEQLYLRQRAHTLETRLAEIDDAPDASADYQLGMKAALEEELQSLWVRLSELETEESKVNHVASPIP